MQGQYVVVLFPEEDDTSGIILKSWLKGDGCLWPRQTKYVHSLLKAKATPGADWIEVPCTVVREFGKLFLIYAVLLHVFQRFGQQ